MSPTHRKRRRSGIALALGLLVLGMIVLVFGVLLHRVHQARTVQSAEFRALQAGWLAESGLERASVRLAEDPDYSGETWVVPSADLGGLDGARVEIRVEPIDNQPALRRVRVRADYPDNRWTRVRRTKTGILELYGANRPSQDGHS